MVERHTPESSEQSHEAGPELKLEGRSWELPSDMKVLEQVTNEVERRLKAAGWEGNDVDNILMGVQEAVTNAIVHGNLSVGGIHTYPDKKAYDEARVQAMGTEFGKRLVHMSVDIEPDRVNFRVRDEGQGFQVEEVADPTDEANLMREGGRGVLLMKGAFDIVGYNQVGNEVRMEKRRSVAA